MPGIRRILCILVVGCVLVSSSIAYNWNPSNGGAEPVAAFMLTPSSVTLQEGESISLNLSFALEDGPPLSTVVSWDIYASGGKGSLRCASALNDAGQLTATYEAPKDVDVRRHNVTIEARTTWLGKTFLDQVHCVVVPKM
ncbi:MAG: hypothetical protein ACP5FL_07980, partial [Thermoplasmatota archaeon]